MEAICLVEEEACRHVWLSLAGDNHAGVFVVEPAY